MEISRLESRKARRDPRGIGVGFVVPVYDDHYGVAMRLQRGHDRGVGVRAIAVCSVVAIVIALTACGASSGRSATGLLPTSTRQTSTTGLRPTSTRQTSTTAAPPTGPAGGWRAVDAGTDVPLNPACVSATICLITDINRILRTNNGGLSWTVSRVAGLTPAFTLEAISCTGTVCVAVGHPPASTSPSAFVTHDLGATWRAVTLPLPALQDQIYVEGVSCGSQTSCTAVGEDHGHSLFWTTENGGQTWRYGQFIVDVGSFGGIACTGSAFCVAVNEQGIVTSTASPPKFAFASTPASWSESTLSAVSCAPGTQSCVVVGSSNNCLLGSPCSPIIGISSDGIHWSSTSVPPHLGFMAGVSCATGPDCIAGGYAPGPVQNNEPGSPGSTFLLARNAGSAAWTPIPLPSLKSGSLEGLYGISCATESFCLAGGVYSGLGTASNPYRRYVLIGPS